jgi:hypothetical protein
VFSEPEDEKDSDAVLETRPSTTSAIKKTPQMADDLVDHLFEIDHFMTGATPFEQQSKITSLFTVSSVIHSTLFHHPDNFQPGTPMSFQ